jgi:hypothetical protein
VAPTARGRLEAREEAPEPLWLVLLAERTATFRCRSRLRLRNILTVVGSRERSEKERCGQACTMPVGLEGYMKVISLRRLQARTSQLPLPCRVASPAHSSPCDASPVPAVTGMQRRRSSAWRKTVLSALCAANVTGALETLRGFTCARFMVVLPCSSAACLAPSRKTQRGIAQAHT